MDDSTRRSPAFAAALIPARHRAPRGAINELLREHPDYLAEVVGHLDLAALTTVLDRVREAYPDLAKDLVGG